MSTLPRAGPARAGARVLIGVLGPLYSRFPEILATSGMFAACTGPLHAQTKPALMAVFAHPDDERIAGPLLARYAREGHDVYLVIATDGRKGVRDYAGIPAGDSLANVRATEAACAAQRLGMHPPILLGFEDAGLSNMTTLARLRDELRRVMREHKPDAVITFGPEGGTGHPDHRLVGVVVTEVVQGGGAGVPDALFYPSLPTERMKDAPPARPQINTVPQKLLTVSVPFQPQDFEKARSSFSCHQSQYTPDEQRALMAYLKHGYVGSVHLRPWRESAPKRLFNR